MEDNSDVGSLFSYFMVYECHCISEMSVYIKILIRNVSIYPNVTSFLKLCLLTDNTDILESWRDYILHSGIQVLYVVTSNCTFFLENRLKHYVLKRYNERK